MNKDSFVALDARIEKMEKRLLRIERRLHLDAPLNVLDELPATPPLSSPVVQTPTSFSPPFAQTPIVSPPVDATPIVSTPIVSTPITATTEEIASPDAQIQAQKPTTSAPNAQPAMPAQPAEKSLLDWEQIVGGKWALWAGLLSIFGAIASFLAYTWRFLPPPPPEAKVAMGFFAGVAFLVAGEWMRKRAQNWFCEGLSGAGLAICFLSLWAGGAYFSIFSFAFTFGAMAIICALGVWLAVRTDALSLHILSVLGGFLTPILLRGDGAGGDDTTITLLSYIAVLNAGVLGVSLFKRWRASVWLSFGATVALLLFWSDGANLAAMRPTVFAFYSLYFLLYIAAACFYSLARREETAPEEIGLIVAATTLYAPFAHGLLAPALRAFPGAFEFGFALFWAALCGLTMRLAPVNRTLRDVFGALGLLAFTVAIPIQVAQPWLGVALVGEAAVLTWLSRRSEGDLLHRAGQIVWFTALFPLVGGMISSGSNVDFGLHAGGWPYLFGVAVTAWLAWSAHRRTDKSDELRDVYAACAVAGGAWLVAREALAWTGEINVALIALAIYAAAVFALGALTRFIIVRIGASLLCASAAATAIWLAWSNPAPELLPFWNARFTALTVTIGAMSAIYQLAKTIDFPLHAAEKEVARAFPFGLVSLMLAAFSSELYFGFAHFAAPQWANRAFFALAIVWSLAALGALLVGIKSRDKVWRIWAYLVGGAALASLPVNALANSAVWMPFANWRFGAFAICVIVAAVAAWLLCKAKNAGIIGETETDAISAFASAALVLALFSLTQETWEMGRYLAPTNTEWQRGAQMAISLVWSLFGALLLATGVHFRVQGARLGALALLAFTVCKVFLFDLSFLDGAGRALSLGGLGLALVFISWLYGRFGRASATT